MIRPIKITLNASFPEIPLIEATTFVGSPSAVFISGVPATVGLWRITAVKIVAHYPDDSATTVECVKDAAGVWTGTLPATATSGRVTHGFEVLADGLDENGDAVTGYVLGFADFAVFTRDMTIDSGGTLYYMHYFDTVPEAPKKGDVAPDGSGGLQLYNGTAWVSMGGYTPPAGGIPKTDLASGVQTSLEKADTAFQKPSNGIPKTDLASGVQASLEKADSAIQGVKKDGATLTPDANKVVDIPAETKVAAYALPDECFPVTYKMDRYLDVTLQSNEDIEFIENNDAIDCYNRHRMVFEQFYFARFDKATLKFRTDYPGNSRLRFNGVTPVDNTSPTLRNDAVYVRSMQVAKEADVAASLARKLNKSGDQTLDGILELPAITVTERINLSALFSIDRFSSSGIVFIGNINNTQRRALLLLSRVSDSSNAIIAFLQNLAPDYDATSTYALDKLCVYSGALYRCTTAIETAEEWTAAHWTEATVEDVLAAIRSALALKAPLASPAFTGTPTAPNLTDQSADGQVANKKYVDDKVAGVSVTPLSGQTFDFATMQGIFAGVKACIEALGGSVTNFPAIPANE